MEFSIPESLRTILGRVRDVVDRQVLPLEPMLLSGPFADLLPALKAVRDDVRARRLWAPQLPREFGGMGLSLLEFALVAEELGRSPLGNYAFNCQAPDAGNMELAARVRHRRAEANLPRAPGARRGPKLLRHDRARLPRLEPGLDGDAGGPRRRELRHRRPQMVRIGGRRARFAIVMAVTDPEAEPHRRASLLIVPSGTPGFRRVRNIACMGHAGDDWASHAELAFEECRVPRENLLGEEGAGFAMAQARLGPGRIHHAMRWIGVCRRAFAMLCDRAASRELAPGDPLGGRQTVQEWIAESRASIDSARLLVLHAAWTIDTSGPAAAREAISLVKFHVAGVMQQVIDRAIQAHGALGISDDTVLSWFYRQERAARIYDGPDEVHKAVVARRILAGRARPHSEGQR